jgi:hypothetical protein
MPTQSVNTFLHRRKENGSHDSICLACLATISSQVIEAGLIREEEDHVCPRSFGSIRSKRPIQTVPAIVRFPPHLPFHDASAAGSSTTVETAQLSLPGSWSSSEGHLFVD